MKKAYNQTWVQNLEIQRVTKTWLQKNLLTAEQFEAIKNHFPEGFYRPDIFVKIGLFIFATIACSVFSGFLSLFFLEAKAFPLMCILCAVGFFFMLEFLIRERKLFHSGIDNALLYAALGATILLIFLTFEHLENWQYCACILVVLVLAMWRYADVFVAIATFGTLVVLVATLLMKFPLGKALLPFGLMLLSALIYYVVRQNKNSYYADNQQVIEVLALIIFYLGGNYFIVREANARLNNLPTNPSPQIAFASLFYVFTTIIPVIYIIFGLRRKDRKLLIVGLLTVAFSVFSYRYYFAFLPIEWALTLGGIVLILLAALTIRYLKTPKHGITDEPDGERKLGNLETLIISQSLGQNANSQPKGTTFGGGDFGGGGAGNEY